MPTERFRLFRFFLPALIVVALGAAYQFAGQWGKQSNTNPPLIHNAPVVHGMDMASEDSAPAVSAGVRIHIDPVTGRIVPPPPPALAPRQPVPPGDANALSTSGDGLVEERGTTPAGGIKIDVRGRFRSAAAVRVGPDGKLTIQCVPDEKTAAEPTRRQGAL